ncbi:MULTISPECIES: hypothetical protein [Rhodopseudomonas]|uniref:hypothetical protein n=1 Tax=Rhodopseudomonas TaxID=1073 RepID=UPI0009BA3223|nr:MULTISPECIES: hypothetical protein [Rhodopseudomonas]MDF3814448.1 hypothetical protein [Rhodopseudomonas sp. BAL398]WOK18889.1 hypothetical protein RBJ75_05010 [Rhodopseudomonas sp. BAL398]
MTRTALRYATKIALLWASLAAMVPLAALAQSGSAGGRIGNDDKSLSGSRQAPRSVDTERAARRSKPKREKPHRATSRNGGSGRGSFDGAWAVVSVGCGGTSTSAVVVSSGRVIGQGVSGTVSANGSAKTVGNYQGITIISSGHVSGRSGSGTFRRSDGCSGRWTSTKQ